MRRKKNRRPDTPPAPATEPVSAPVADAGELNELRERLDRMEREQRQDGFLDPIRARLRDEQRWLASNSRAPHADEPCPACGAVGGAQRRSGAGLSVLAGKWVCEPCSAVIEPGWGTKRRTLLPHGTVLDRLASLAACQAEPTPSFRALAARYGLPPLQLARDADTDAGDGTAWGHLDRAAWAAVGARATRRHNAGFGPFPAASYADVEKSRETMIANVPDPGHPRGWSRAVVPVPLPDPSPEELAARLRAEEGAIEAALVEQQRARVRAAKERAAAEDAARRQREILSHHAEHKARLEAEISRSRAGLAKDLRSALALHAERGL